MLLSKANSKALKTHVNEIFTRKLFLLTANYKKVTQSRYRPGVPQRVPGS